MANLTFEQIADAAKALTAEEQLRLKNLIELWLCRPSSPPSSSGAPTEEELAEEMLRDGILDRVPTPTRDVESFEKYTPVAIEGEPLSETIIKERG